MKYKFFYILILLLNCYYIPQLLVAQNDEQSGFENKYVSSPSYNGVSGISIPIFSLGTKWYGISNNLNTQIDAIPVNYTGGSTGLNWNMDYSIPHISREVRGFPDDIYKNTIKNADCTSNADVIYYVGYFYNSSYYHASQSDYTRDYEPDIFTLSLYGNSYKFYLETTFDNPYILETKIRYVGESPPAKVTANLETGGDPMYTNIPCFTGFRRKPNPTSYYIKSFTVSTLNGLKIDLDVPDHIFSKTFNLKGHSEINDNDITNYPNNYFYQPLNQNGSLQDFYQTKWSASAVMNRFDEKIAEFFYDKEVTEDHKINYQIDPKSSTDVTLNTTYFQHVKSEIVEIRLIDLEDPNANITINYFRDVSRPDLSGGAFLSVVGGDSIKGAELLTKIELRKGSHKYQTISFNYANFKERNSQQARPNLTAHFRRIKLESIDLINFTKIGSFTTKTYRFRYDERYTMPPRHSGNVDMFGYYNGNSSAESLLPKFYYDGSGCGEDVSNLNIYNGEYCYRCSYLSLTTKLPEDNDFNKTNTLIGIVYPNLDQLILNTESHVYVQNGITFKGGGLRLSRSTIYNGYGSTEYTYNYNNGQPGVLFNNIGYKTKVKVNIDCADDQSLSYYVNLTSNIDYNLIPKNNIYYPEIEISNQLAGRFIQKYIGIDTDDDYYIFDGEYVYDRKFNIDEKGYYYCSKPCSNCDLNCNVTDIDINIRLDDQFHPVILDKTEYYDLQDQLMNKVDYTYKVLHNAPIYYFPNGNGKSASLRSNLIIKPKTTSNKNFLGATSNTLIEYFYDSEFHTLPTKTRTTYNGKNVTENQVTYNIDNAGGVTDTTDTHFNRLIPWNGIYETRLYNNSNLVDYSRSTFKPTYVSNNSITKSLYLPTKQYKLYNGTQILTKEIDPLKSEIDSRLNILKYKNSLSGYEYEFSYLLGRLESRENITLSRIDSFQYNFLGELVRKDFADGSFKKNIEYDQYGNVTYYETPGLTSDTVGEEEFIYDYFVSGGGTTQITKKSTIDGIELPNSVQSMFTGSKQPFKSKILNHPNGEINSSTTLNTFGKIKSESTSGLSSLNYIYDNEYASLSIESYRSGMEQHKRKEIKQIEYASNIGRSTDFDKVYVSIIYDENDFNNPVKVYKNYKGETIRTTQSTSNSGVQTTDYYYDILGRILKVIENDSSEYTYSYTYNSSANILTSTKTNPQGVITTTKTNLRGDVIETRFPSSSGGIEIIEYNYDSTYLDLIEVKRNGQLELEYSYIRLSDCNPCIGKLDNLQTKKVKILGSSDSIQYIYEYNDSLGRISKTTVLHPIFGNSSVEVLNYNHLDLPTKIETKVYLSSETITYKEKFTYDDAGRVLFYQNDLFNSSQYRDLYGQEFRITDQVKKTILGDFDTPLETINYTYNDHGWLTAINDIGECDLNNTAGGGTEIDPLPLVSGDTERQKSGSVSVEYDLDDIHNGSIAVKVNAQIHVIEYNDTFPEGNILHTEELSDTLKITAYHQERNQEPSPLSKFYEIYTYDSRNDTNELYHTDLNYIPEEDYLDSNRVYFTGEVYAELISAQLMSGLVSKLKGENIKLQNHYLRRIEEYSVNVIDKTARRIPSEDCNFTHQYLFSQRILYDNSFPQLESEAYYNGNISTTKWRTLDQDGYSAYGYQYDEYYRLKHAKYGEYNFTTESWQKGQYNTSIHYDNSSGDIGNISVIKRKGYDPVSDSYKLVDDIIMNHTGHRLTAINTSTFHDSNLGYKSNTGSFTYDARGNITSATGKGISEIVYNHLDLPISITHTSGSVTFVYDAEGGLVSQVSNLNNLTVSKSYYGGLEFESRQYADNVPNPGYVNSESISFYHDYGRIVRKKSGGMTFDNVEYVLRDHLGNTRVTFSDINNDGTIDRDPQNGEILKIAHYYPFGMEMQGKWDYTPSSEVTPYDYGYNGIQELSDLQLNFSTYRILDPGIGRWYQVDPKAEKLYGYSSYNSMLNNPVKYKDPHGDIPFFILPEISIGSDGFSFGIQAGIGVPGAAFLSISIGAGVSDGKWSGYASVQGGFAGFYASVGTNGFTAGYGFQYGGISAGASWSPSAGWGVGIGYGGQDPATGIGMSLGVGYNQNGGLSVNSGISYYNSWEIERPEVYHSPVGDNHLDSKSVNGDCGYNCLAEIAESYGFSERDLEYWLALSGKSRGEGMKIREIQSLINSSQEFKSDINGISPRNTIETITDIKTSFKSNKRVIAGFEYYSVEGGELRGHATTIQKVKIWPSGRYRVYFNQTSPSRISPYTSSNLRNDFHNIWFINAYKR